MNDNAHITIRRGKSYTDWLRAYKVTLDGAVAASVRAGQSVTVPVAAGRHTFGLRIDWCGSEDLQFEVRPGEHATFECGSSLAGWRIVLFFVYVLFRTREYLWLRRAE